VFLFEAPKFVFANLQKSFQSAVTALDAWQEKAPPGHQFVQHSCAVDFDIVGVHHNIVVLDVLVWDLCWLHSGFKWRL
jgi:hypothetical protein